jgi:predicted lipoprotein with Yx(FWY)xxD motif
MAWRCVTLALPCALTLPFALVLPSAVMAQPVDLPVPPATTSEYPPGVKVAKSDSGPVYVDARGRTLYGMDMRTLIRWAPDPAQYCQDECATQWEPLLAPTGSLANIAYPKGFGDQQQKAPPQGQAVAAPAMVQPQSAPDWTIIEGPQGPQWVYGGWHMVFTRKGEKRGQAQFDGAQDFTWNTLKFVPPVPKIEAPARVGTVLAGGQYAFADKDGRVLFTGKCKADCAGWVPLSGGMASRGIGNWTIGQTGERPQWLYGGKPVFVSQEVDPLKVPASATALRP